MANYFDLKIKYVIFFFVFVHFTTAFVWESNVIVRRAKNCDFVGNDIETFKVTFPEVCEASCRDNPLCTHFSWSARQGGTCVLKSSEPLLSDPRKYESLAVNATQPGSVCGFLDFSWEDERIFTFNCDFVDTKTLDTKTMGINECVNWCVSTVQCTHFTFTMLTDFQQDSVECLLKTGRVSKQDAKYSPHIMCGVSGNYLPETGSAKKKSVSSRRWVGK